MNGHDLADTITQQVDAAARRLAIESRSLLGLPDEGPSCHASTSRTSSWCRHLKKPPSPVEFLRILGKHMPVLIDECMTHRACSERWKDSQYMIERMGEERRVQVAVTPNGRADDVHTLENGSDVFVLPHDENMTFAELFAALKRQEADPSADIVYLQSQNSNLTEASGEESSSGDLSPLLADLMGEHLPKDGLTGATLSWADEALGKQPEATNLWIGSSASKTSMHRDHYENLFTVLRGTKTFTLYPPCEAHFLCDDEAHDVWQWQPSKEEKERQWTMSPAEDTPPTPWIPIDPTEPPTSERNRRFPRFSQALSPLSIEVREGETLYLPAGWYHHVAQRGDDRDGICVCVNWWYESDFAFSDRWALEEFVREMGQMARGHS